MAITIKLSSLTTSTFGFQDNGSLQFVAGDVLPTWVAGTVGTKAIDMTAGDTGWGFLRNSNSPLWGATTMSVSFWFNPTYVLAGPMIAKFDNFGTVNGYQIYLNDDGSISLLIGYGDTILNYQLDSAGFTAIAGTWYNLIWISNNKNHKVYINKTLVIDQTVAKDMTVDYSTPFYLGNNTNEDASTSFAGKIDELIIYNSAISATEINTIYAKGTPTNPSAWYKFEEGKGLQAFDTISYYNNAFINQVNALSVTSVYGFRNLSSSKTNCRPMLLYV